MLIAFGDIYQIYSGESNEKIILAGVLATMMGSAPVMAATATTTTPAQATTANVQKKLPILCRSQCKAQMRCVIFSLLVWPCFMDSLTALKTNR